MANAKLGADVSIDGVGIHLYGDISAYFDVDDQDWTCITLTPEQAAALGEVLIAASKVVASA